MNVLAGLLSIVENLLNVYIWIIIIAALLSWVKPDPNNQLVQMLYRLTQPAYDFIRKYMRTDFNGIDLAPIIIIVALQVVDVLLINLIRSL